ncbi:hypothetical protein FNF29_04269 [Cafeteria roenbergensis]|uniref:Uncharacterized protein n=1 Tax=Cafeteria roenbergensis TaxID=33653 RepID=A0A5A8CFP3_CAFRO|nr:hypothetical protein FNF29_04269 [Cafeteria roenbergensis]|eukprot:KAA0151863.1 hypothetical protein FNF29_04269 [Cafeteria roenbergensis]
MSGMGSKGVMMAERPSAQPTAFGSASGGGAAASSIGNYKGVMLCNRPTGGGAGGAGGGAGTGGGPGAGVSGNFRAGLKPERVNPTGHDPGAEERRALSKVLARKNRSKEPTVFQKHRAWLRELAEQRRALEEEKARLEAEAEAKKRKQRAKNQEIRDSIRTAEGAADGSGDAEAPKSKPQRKPAAAGGAGAGAGGGKPAWAMTAEQKEAADEAEAEDLLAFAEGLDLDDYLDDVEVRSALQVVRDRLAALDAEGVRREREHKAAKKRAEAEFEYEWVDAADDAAGAEDGAGGSGEGADGDGADADPGEGWEWADEEAAPVADPGDEGSGGGAGRRRRLRRRKRPDLGVLSAAGDGAAGAGRAKPSKGGDDNASVAESIMSSASSARFVHSKRSLTAMVERERRRMSEEAALPDLPDEDEEVAPPRIVTHDGSAESKAAKERHLATTLPFRNRNPYV